MITSYRFDALFRLALIGSSLFFAICSFAATSVSQYGITWTFSADHTIGQYANGDYWVVGPVTITNITPASTIDGTGRTINGSMVNPVAGAGVNHGFDSALAGDGSYRATLNAARPGGNDLSSSNPLVLAAGSSLISSISHPTPIKRPQLTDAAVLTIVASAPADGSFRPPYCGTDKTHHWNKSALNYGILRTLEPVSGTPSLSVIEGNFARPWIEIETEFGGRFYHPSNNQPDYGRDMAMMLGDGLLSLHLNYSNAAKETLFVRLVQYGLDVYGAAVTGGFWKNNGGHNQGRKMPLILAGLAFNDTNILAYGNAATHFIFQEDQQTWYVDASDVGRPLNHTDGRLRVEYIEADIGVPEWGEKHSSTPNRDGRNWDTFYRDINYQSLVQHALAAHLTAGAKAVWNWDAFFDYYDRAKNITPSNNWSPFVNNMWTNYRNLGDSQPTVIAPSSARVSITVQ